MSHSIKSISCPDLRSTVGGLVAQGWSAEKKKGGHIKLVHPDASRPVFTSSTPSDRRVSLNILSECRSVLRKCTDESANLVTEDSLNAALRRSSKLKKMSRSNLSGSTSMPTQTSFDLSPKAADPLTDFKGRVGTSKPRAKMKSTSEPVKTNLKPKEKELAVMLDMNTDIPLKDPMPTVKAEAPAILEAVPHAAEALAQHPAPAPAVTLVQPAPQVRQAPFSHISHDVLRLAQALSDGSLRRLEITADMIGGTLLHGGDLYFVAPDAAGMKIASSATPSEATSHQSSEWTGPGPNYGQTEKGFMDKKQMFSVLKQFPGEWLSTKDISNLVWQDCGYKNFKSCRASLQKYLDALLADGDIQEKRSGREMFYRAKSAEA